GPISPSRLGGAHALPGTPEDPDALARGSRLHAALERLAALPASERPAAARRLLPEAEADAALALLALPGAAEAFGPDSLAEVAITARLDALGGRQILGRIDRLMAGPDHLLALDIKTNALPPDRPEAVPEGILRQMGAYQAALERIHPGRSVRTAILWTAAPRVMHLPRALVMAALHRAAAELDPAGGGA
ncbi:MAG: double-strand break repair helicase AddA, partial [Alphaproteobacteria bacterium]